MAKQQYLRLNKDNYVPNIKYSTVQMMKVIIQFKGMTNKLRSSLLSFSGAGCFNIQGHNLIVLD
jgi:hypothetical protein